MIVTPGEILAGLSVESDHYYTCVNQVHAYLVEYCMSTLRSNTEKITRKKQLNRPTQAKNAWKSRSKRSLKLKMTENRRTVLNNLNFARGRCCRIH